MRSMKLIAATLVVFTACGGPDAEPGPEAGAPAPAAAPAGAQGAAPRAVAGTEDALSYRLTMPVVRRWFDAMGNVARVLSQDEDLADEFQAPDGVSVDALEAHYDGMPEIRRAITQAGLDVREFATILIALPHAQSAQKEIDDGADRESIIARRQVNPANLDFVRENRAELQRLEREGGMN